MWALKALIALWVLLAITSWITFKVCMRSAALPEDEHPHSTDTQEKNLR